MTAVFARPFRLVAADGSGCDGVEFPSGRVVLDHPAVGLRYAAVSLDVALADHDGARVIWGQCSCWDISNMSDPEPKFATNADCPVHGGPEVDG